MRTACAECGCRVGHEVGCFLTPPPPSPLGSGNPLLMDAIVQSDHHQTWTA